MIEKFMSFISDKVGITSLKREIHFLHDGIVSLQKILADQELRAATWHVGAINHQRKLETSMAALELTTAGLTARFAGQGNSAGVESSTALEELRREVQELRQTLGERKNGM